MKWPFVSRSKYEGHVSILQMNINTLKELAKAKSTIIEEQAAKLAEKDSQIKALLAQVTEPKCNALHSKVSDRPKKIRSSGDALPLRGGWRGMSQQYSMATVEPATDSMQQLDQRVEAQGGTK